LDNIHPPLYFLLLKVWLALTGVSPFTGRYLSALAGLLQVALVFSAVRDWGGTARRTTLPWIAAGLMLISPLSVIYSQEIRVYAMLPLAYIAAILLAGRLVGRARPATRGLIWLAVVEWVGLHLHYIAIFGVAYIALWGLLAFLRRRDATGARSWIATHAIVAAASMPWLLAVLRNWATISAEANAGTYTTEAVPLPYLFSQVWVFHLTGLAGALASDFVRVAAGAAAILVLGLVGFHVWRSRYKGPWKAVPGLMSHWLAPLIPALFVWSVRSFSHPRYVIMFAAMLIPLVAFLIYSPRRRAPQLAGAALAVCVVSLSFWGLGRYFFSAEVAKPDIRGVASRLEAVAGPGDVVFVPDTDWSLPFEYSGEAAVVMPHLSEPPDAPDSTLTRALDCTGGVACAESGRVYVVDYPRSTRDWQSRLPFELERRGYWFDTIAFNGVDLREYRLTQRAAPLPGCSSPAPGSSSMRFDALHVESTWIEQDAAADTAVAVALCWRLTEPAMAADTVSLMLRDPVTGERIAQTDTLLLNKVGAMADRWRPGEAVTTYHLLPLPTGTPPVEMELLLGVYRSDDAAMNLLEAVDEQGNPIGRLIPLGAVSLSPPVGSNPREVDQMPLWETPVELADGLQLAGARFNPGPFRPGQAVRVSLMWRATADSLPDLRPSLRLERDGVILAENVDAPANGRYPTDRWRRGEMVFEVRDVRVPAGADGPVQLAIGIDGGQTLPLGELTASGAAILYDRPAPQNVADAHFEHGITLIGYDLPPEVVAIGHAVPITLYWESDSGAIPAGYSVFIHLLGEDEAIIAQSDSPPAHGSRPTDEWLPGEFIVDPHELIWRETGAGDEARIVVGLYDSSTGRRLTTADGADSVTLSSPLRINAAP